MGLKDGQGRVPLFCAAEEGRQDIVETLLARGAKVGAKMGKRSAVHFAAAGGHGELAKWLAGAGGPVDVKAKNDWTELHERLWLGPGRVAEILIDVGMDACLMGKSYGKTQSPLHLAVKASYTEVYRDRGLRRRLVTKLLDGGADPNVLNSEGESPVHVACSEGHAEIVEVLLDRGGEIEGVDSSGATPLFFAVQGANLRTIRLLLDRGAKTKAVLPASAGEFAGATAADMAERFGHRFVLRLLRERGKGRKYAAVQEGETVSRAEVHSACWHGDVEDVRWILDQDAAEVRALRGIGFTTGQPLTAAATAGYDAVVKLLIERGALVNDPTFGEYTPLFDAARQGHAGVVKILAGAGADLNANAGKRPALVEAAEWGYVDVVRVMLEAGAEVNAKNDEGRTALWVAEKGRPFGGEEGARACAAVLRGFGGKM